jgi:hypothetical protein
MPPQGNDYNCHKLSVYGAALVTILALLRDPLLASLVASLVLGSSCGFWSLGKPLMHVESFADPFLLLLLADYVAS